MKCVLCKNGEAAPGTANVTLHRDQASVNIKNAPADVCQNRGGFYLADDVARQTTESAEAEVARGAELEVQQFAA